MFTALGIRVRAHASLLIFIAGIILLDFERGYPIQYRAFSMALFISFIILHEFGHCLAARWLGGTANDVLLWPLGGLAYTDPPHRPGAFFITAAAGPAVNLGLCLVGIAGFYFTTPAALMHGVHLGYLLNPFHFTLPVDGITWSDPAFYFWWLFIANYVLFLFNLLPIYPMDGGQMAQAGLWPLVGHYRSMMMATMTGMVGAVLAGVAALALQGWWFALFMVWCFYTCYQQRLALREAGPEDWRDSIDYSASIYAAREPAPRKHRFSRRALRKARRIALREKAERDRIDAILAKVSAHGMNSLTWTQRRTLHRETQRQRRQELEMSRFQ
jgi:Zn-dependent protease